MAHSQYLHSAQQDNFAGSLNREIATIFRASDIVGYTCRSGYHPGSVHAPAGKPVRLVFTRTSDEGCGHQLVFPTLGIRKDLPLNRPVMVDLATSASGSAASTCGMNVLRGWVVVQ